MSNDHLVVATNIVVQWSGVATCMYRHIRVYAMVMPAASVNHDLLSFYEVY